MVSRFERLGDDTYTEHDSSQGWIGTSRFQHGLATGRPSPVAPSRVRPVTAIMRDRPDLVTETDVAGHGHGQLFDVAPYVREKNEVLGEAGVPARRASSGEGFLPRLGTVAGESDPARRQAIAEDKAAVIRHAGVITRPVHMENPGEPPMFDTNASHGAPGTSTPMRTQLENRRQFVHPSTTGDWYIHESEQVNEAATRAGVHHGVMRRAVAYASPKTPWNVGNPQDNDVRYPNIENAEGVVGHVVQERKRAANEGRGFDPVAAAMSTRVPTVSGEGDRKPVFDRVMLNIGESMAGTSSPSDRIVTSTERKGDRIMTGEKVPNFDLALERGSPSRAARRESAQAYTSDVWDVKTAGLGDYSHIAGGGLTPPGGTQRRTGGDKGLVPARPRGQYDVIATTGRRAGLKEGMLPSEFQQHAWRNVRGTTGVARPEQSFDFERTGHRGLGPRFKSQMTHREQEDWIDKNMDF